MCVEFNTHTGIESDEIVAKYVMRVKQYPLAPISHEENCKPGFPDMYQRMQILIKVAIDNTSQSV